MTVRAVCFDLDGTLLRDDHVDGVVRRVADELAQRYGIDAAELTTANERVWWEYWPEIGDRWMRGEVPGDDAHRGLARALAAVGVTDQDAAAEAFRLHTGIEGATFALYPEAADVLAQLRARGIRIAIITNGPSGLQRSKPPPSGSPTGSTRSSSRVSRACRSPDSVIRARGRPARGDRGGGVAHRRQPGRGCHGRTRPGSPPCGSTAPA